MLKGTPGVMTEVMLCLMPVNVRHQTDLTSIGIGTMLGACSDFEIEVRGKGGHAAMPHTTVDPVVAGAAIVTALQVTSTSSMRANLDVL